MTVLKACSKCEQSKPQSYFPKAKAWKDGFYPQCKACKNAGQKAAYAENPEPAKERAREYRDNNIEEVREKERLRSLSRKALDPEEVLNRNRKYYWRAKYGITPEQYQELLVKQESRCAVCNRHQDELKKILAVDHDHKTLEIRGLLCTHCNLRVIGKHRDPEIFRKAAEYLAQGTGWFTPKKRRSRRPRKVKNDRNSAGPEGPST